MSRLPASLARWEESLTGVDAEAAVALGPLLPVLDEMVGRLDDGRGESGELDGYDGIVRRGDPARLLMSEWLLADELPLEFVRRAAENELAYLRPAHRAPQQHGTVVALCDVGPEQWGSGRLVQLAGLVVLDRRARVAGSVLEVNILQDGARLSGSLEEILQAWRGSRSLRPPAEAEVAQALDAGRPDRLWLLSGPGTRTLASRHRRALSSWPAAWGEGRVLRVGIRVGDATAELPLPEPALAIAALRGGHVRRSGAGHATVGTTGQGAVFGAVDSRLVWRGERAQVVHSCFVGKPDPPAVRRHVMPGAVLAASSVGRRLVAVVTDGERVRVHVVGKSLARTELIDVPLQAVNLGADDIDALVAEPLCPVYLRGPQILTRLAGMWWSLDAAGAWPTDADTVSPGPALDTPMLARRLQSGRVLINGAELGHADATAGLVLGPQDGGGSWAATSTDTRVWVAWANGEPAAKIAVPEGERVLGLTVLHREPALVVVSGSGRILRAITSNHTKTWTRWAGPAHFDLHPARPWIVRSKDDGILVGDLATGLTLADIRVAG